MPINLFDAGTEGLAKALSVHQLRHQILASNIANVETPGYRAQEVDFRETLRNAFVESSANTPGTTEPPRRTEDLEAPMGADGNSVDIDLQMAKLASNSGRFNTLAKILGKRFTMIRQAIDGVR